MINNLNNIFSKVFCSEDGSSLISHLLDNVPVGILISNPNKLGNPVLYANLSYIKSVKLNPDEIINRNLYDILSIGSDDATKLKIINISNTEENCTLEVVNLLANGDKVFNKVTKHPIYDSNNNLIYFLTYINDVTNEVQLKNIAKESSNLKSNFLSTISHEIRTPLNSIIGTIELLSENNSDSCNDSYLKLLKRSSTNLLKLIDEMLELQSPNANMNKNLFNFNQLINDSINKYVTTAEEKGLNFIYKFDNKIPETLIGDDEKLNRIISTLIDNAIKFTDKGEIIFDASIRHRSSNKVSINFMVKDTGAGIDDKQLPYIFDSFSQVISSPSQSWNGPELELAITKKHLAAMNGHISVDSKLDIGTTFIFDCEFELPTDIVTNETPNSIETATIPQSKNILLVDDSEDNRFLMKAFLKKTTLVVDTAENGEEAFEKFKNNNYDLILMDIQMPIMDGYTSTRLIRNYEIENNLPKTTISALTAYAFDEDIEKALEAGCNFVLTKPVKKAVLLDTIKDVLQMEVL
ncbi:response regulator [Clostridium cellulovorans]|uniref:Stage 0 sporulation protein A homolog n=1 Tax=Clostridium cellulovorans (strain ATCC 35296 / DSM 3052 / OCM 3 / 743B) TaxID=573061 RepID=D9STB6_CLOC7|nr:response regulator [Clostridium cellulovorans]ADL50732.1 PAS/PAC sensor hybrid histidine kinase [Clostridium cellulovorans 743B]